MNDFQSTATVSEPPATALIEAGRLRRMYCVDTSTNPRIPILMEMVGSVSRARDPQEIYRRFRNGIRKLSKHTAYLALSVRGLEPGAYKITRFEHNSDAADAQPLVNPWKQWDTLPAYSGGFLGELIRAAWPELIHNLDIHDDPAVGDLLRPFESMIAVPIFDTGRPLNWAILLSEQRDAFDVKDLEETILRANLIGGMTRNSLVTLQLAEAQAQLTKEVERIGLIQRALLPDPLPTIAGMRIASSYETSQKAGGDYYDFFALEHDEQGRERADGRWGILVADASGHGPSAAVVMAMLHAILHAFAECRHSTAAVLENANRHLCAKKIESSFVTAFYAVYDPVARTLEYARAGHNPPLVKRGEEMRRLDRVGGLPLGVDGAMKLETHTEQLAPGETLVFYTDGITEAMDDERRMFGIEGIERALHDCTGEPECTIRSINAALRAHEGGAAAADDQTIVAMKLD